MELKEVQPESILRFMYEGIIESLLHSTIIHIHFCHNNGGNMLQQTVSKQPSQAPSQQLKEQFSLLYDGCPWVKHKRLCSFPSIFGLITSRYTSPHSERCLTFIVRVQKSFSVYALMSEDTSITSPAGSHVVILPPQTQLIIKLFTS